MPERKPGDIAILKGVAAMRVQFDWDSYEMLGWIMPDGKVFPDSRLKDGEIGPTLWNVHDMAKASTELWPETPEEIREDLHGEWSEREEMTYWHGRAVGHAWNDVARQNGRREVITLIRDMDGPAQLLEAIKEAFPHD